MTWTTFLPVLATGLVLGAIANTELVAANDQPTANKRRAMQRCIYAKSSTTQPLLACVGTISGPCLDKPAGQTTVGMRQCLNRETVVWDEILNKKYARLRASVSPNGANTLRNIQREWIKWRKAKCQLGYVLNEGGTLAGVLAGDCYMRTTALRAVELTDALGQASGRPVIGRRR